MKSKLRVASISDIHLGHHNTLTVDILRNLRAAFPDTEETGELDIIFIGGDLFDRLLEANDPSFYEFKIWAHGFIRMCVKRNIIVRVMEGTPSHDWKLNRHMAEINLNSDYGCDLKYIDTLSIEHIEKLDINVLYVPDEWRHETDETWKEVVQLLQANNLEQVDFTILHGAFTFQLPEHVTVPMHIPERYQAITRHYVFGAHIHRSSQYGNILVNGSFDRLSHNEEEPKGHWRVTLGGATGDQLVFVENKGAKIYRTIDCAGLEVDEALQKLEVVGSLPEGSHVRIAAAKTDPIINSLDMLRKMHPGIRWTTKAVETTEVQTNLLVDLRSTFQQKSITPENIQDMVMERVASLTSDERILNRCRQRLLEMT